MTPQKRAIERKMGKLYADTTMHTIDFQPMIWVNWKKKEARITSIIAVEPGNLLIRFNAADG